MFDVLKLILKLEDFGQKTGKIKIKILMKVTNLFIILIFLQCMMI